MQNIFILFHSILFEVIFSSKYKRGNHPDLSFNGIPVARKDSTNILG